MDGARILIVDDEDSIKEVLGRLLETRGHSVAKASDADEGARRLRAERFDLVLVDLVLPGRTGLEALSEYRSLTDAPIHVMSGQTDADTRKDALLLGASGFLPKPLLGGELEALLAALPPRP